MAAPWVDRLAGVLGRAVRAAAVAGVRAAARSSGSPRASRPAAARRRPRAATRRSTGRSAGSRDGRHTGVYPGDFEGPLTPRYDPHPDGVADPGEVVWTWVPYEEDHSRGKDRPVLVVALDPGRSGWLLALPMTSKDHDRDDEQEAREGRFWCDVGSGPWDSRGRPSEVRVDRVVRVRAGEVRRTGGALDRQRFERVSAAVSAHR